jgi:predicted nucleic acid-binding protein
LDQREVVLVQKIMKHAFEIHIGEAQAIVLTRKMDADTMFLVDESSGREFAEAWGLKVKCVLYVIMTALRRQFIDEVAVKEKVLALVHKGFRVETKLLARVIREIDTYSKSRSALKKSGSKLKFGK